MGTVRLHELLVPASGNAPLLMAMESQLKRDEGARFIGTIERLAEGWRASFRLRVPNDVFYAAGQD
jgi:hypothetical protein